MLGLKYYRANGIAAPQLGWFHRFLLMRAPSTRSLVCWINPVVSTTTGDSTLHRPQSLLVGRRTASKSAYP